MVTEPEPSSSSDSTVVADELEQQRGGANIANSEPEAIAHSISNLAVADLKAFVRMLPPLVLAERPPCSIPKKRQGAPKVSLVLDLDETLVHSSTLAVDAPDHIFPVNLRNVSYTVYARLRPHFVEFMERVCDIFEVIVFTASQRVYAEELLNRIDPKGRYFHHRVYRDSCIIVDGNYLKDLTVLGRDLNHTIIVDNSPISFSYQLDNGVPIESWFDLDQDTELLKLAPFLETLAEVDDVRPHVHNKFWRTSD